MGLKRPPYRIKGAFVSYIGFYRNIGGLRGLQLGVGWGRSEWFLNFYPSLLETYL